MRVIPRLQLGIVLKFQATAVAFGTPRSLPSTEARRAQEHIYEP